MKTLLWTSLLALAGALYFKGADLWGHARAFLGPVEVLDQGAFVEGAAERASAGRVAAGLGPVSPHEEIQIWMSQRASAGRLEVTDASIRELQERHPVFADIVATTLEGRSLREVASRVDEWSVGQDHPFTHLSTWLFRADSAPGRIRCVVAMARELPDFAPELLDQSVAEFCAECRVCGHRQPVATVRGTTGLIMECQRCTKAYGYLQQDLRGRYHYINHFLTGFEPPARFAEGMSRRAEMTAIWKAVVAHCRYAEDVPGVGGPRDQWQMPHETHAYANGDCEDTSILLADWLIARGFEARVALGLLADEAGNTGGHAWVVCRVDGIDYLLESTDDGSRRGRSADAPPTVSELGRHYTPDTLFDRGTLYFRRNAGWTPDYWSAREWYAVPIPPEGTSSGPGDGEFAPSGGAVLATTAPWLEGR